MARLFCSVLLLCLLPLASACQQKEPASRQAEVAARGLEVMPFDLERSTHIFEKIETGGRQQVVSDDNDPDQIALIQSHLKEESQLFSEGNFRDPEMIHGEHMAGMHELQMAKDRIEIEYADLENGGQILYTSEDEALITAIHAWFDAQLSDHGHHAQGNH